MAKFHSVPKPSTSEHMQQMLEWLVRINPKPLDNLVSLQYMT